MLATVKAARYSAVLMLLFIILTLSLLIEEINPHGLFNPFSGFTDADKYLQLPVYLLLLYSIGVIRSRSRLNNVTYVEFSSRIFLPVAVSFLFQIASSVAFKYGYYPYGILWLIAQIICLLLLHGTIQSFFRRFFLDENEYRILTIPFGLYLGLTTLGFLNAVIEYVIPINSVLMNDVFILSFAFTGLFFFVYYLFFLKNIAATIPLSWSVLGICLHTGYHSPGWEYGGRAIAGLIITIFLLYVLTIWFRIRKRLQSF